MKILHYIEVEVRLYFSEVQLRKMTSFWMGGAFGTANAILCNQIEFNI